jgi:hypothetical protein
VLAGTAKVDITPAASVWMDGMLRSSRSRGVHDPLFARALVLAGDRWEDQSRHGDARRAFALVSVDVCALDEATTRAARQHAEEETGIPAAGIVIAATHTHSGPATVGIFNPREDEYVAGLVRQLVAVIENAADSLRPAEALAGTGTETTISHYRRLLADDGHVVMNWEPWPPDRIVRPLGSADPDVSVVKIVPAGGGAGGTAGASGTAGAGGAAGTDAGTPIATLFNHAGHPNILSGDNLLLSSEYPGLAARLLEEETGGTALFFNGAQGSVDIDGLHHRDWQGWENAGSALARGVSQAVLTRGDGRLRGASVHYALPGRRITDAEWTWAQEVLARTRGAVQPLADGVGDDYKALFYSRLREEGQHDLPVEQICVAVGDCALISFPGELYTEIGRAIKARSPFRRTIIIGLANGYAGYIPTEAAVAQGGYAEDTRRADAAAESTVMNQSLTLLGRVHDASGEKE